MAKLVGANSTFSIGGTTVATTEGQYDALTWTEIEQVETLPQFGDESTEVSFIGLSDGRTERFKGTKDAGTATVTMAISTAAIESSPLGGQGLLLAAEADTTSTNYNFRVVYNNAGSGSPQNGSTRYFSGQVMGVREAGTDANGIVMLEATISINTATIRKAAV